MVEKISVGGEFYWGAETGDNFGNATIVRILTVEEAKKYELGVNQCMWTGKNMLDNPENEGKFEKDKVYVFET